ncbi:hypothetical protein [Amycolatopsis sp. SID8362]|uniref:hypothetical protein n=1 Tax=Amycolatopsis sp. SID8362 TaxID=2690346 RepID=UPI00136F8361|nr:hypothetical protein [Amycolatopsis sp. SID8362]NBH03503.1 hypothetical protein [Amycolatopsis sp. SID8362]NED40203.1 hypothetical protein [Amycolatopsis sp. SID8362]
MATVEDGIRTWISRPLLNLRQRRRAERDTPWEAHFEEFVGELGVHDAAQHPVTRSMRARLDALPNVDARDDLIESDEFERIAYDLRGREAGGSFDTPPADPDWYAFCVETLPGWNGEEDSWPSFSQGFLNQARPRAFAAATAFIQRVSAMSPAGRRRYVFAYLNAIPAPDFLTYNHVPDVPVVPRYDIDGWYDFCVSNLPRWNGDNASWPEFTRSFLTEALTRGFNVAAAAFLNDASTKPADGRRTYFAQCIEAIQTTRDFTARSLSGAFPGPEPDERHKDE